MTWTNQTNPTQKIYRLGIKDITVQGNNLKNKKWYIIFKKNIPNFYKRLKWMENVKILSFISFF